MGLHTFFCFLPLDIAYLDKEKKVIKLYKHVLPFTGYIPGVPAQYILECKKMRGLQEGDKMRWRGKHI